MRRLTFQRQRSDGFYVESGRQRLGEAPYLDHMLRSDVWMGLAAEESATPGLTSNALLLAVVGAFLGFLGNYAMERLRARRTPRKELSWELSIDEPQIAYSATNAHRLKISYNGQPVDRLIVGGYSVTNTGTQTIKDQLLRFAFPEDAKVLDFTPNPPPKPEMGLSDVGGQAGFPGYRYKIAHIEPGESVGFLFSASGGTWVNWHGVVPHNEAGDVSYIRKDVSRTRDEPERVAPFLFGISALLVFTLYVLALYLISSLLSRFYIYEYVVLGIVLLLTVVIVVSGANILTHAFRASRVIASAIAGASRTSRMSAYGDNAVVAQSSAGITINMPPQGDKRA